MHPVAPVLLMGPVPPIREASRSRRRGFRQTFLTPAVGVFPRGILPPLAVVGGGFTPVRKKLKISMEYLVSFGTFAHSLGVDRFPLGV